MAIPGTLDVLAEATGISRFKEEMHLSVAGLREGSQIERYCDNCETTRTMDYVAENGNEKDGHYPIYQCIICKTSIMTRR